MGELPFAAPSFGPYKMVRLQLSHKLQLPPKSALGGILLFGKCAIRRPLHRAQSMDGHTHGTGRLLSIVSFGFAKDVLWEAGSLRGNSRHKKCPDLRIQPPPPPRKTPEEQMKSIMIEKRPGETVQASARASVCAHISDHALPAPVLSRATQTPCTSAHSWRAGMGTGRGRGRKGPRCFSP